MEANICSLLKGSLFCELPNNPLVSCSLTHFEFLLLHFVYFNR